MQFAYFMHIVTAPPSLGQPPHVLSKLGDRPQFSKHGFMPQTIALAVTRKPWSVPYCSLYVHTGFIECQRPHILLP